MVKKVNVPVMSRLSKRFDLEEMNNPALPLVLNGVIAPVTNVDELLRKVMINSETADISASSEAYFTVPDGKKWRIKTIGRGASTGASLIIVGSNAVFSTFPERMDFLPGTGAGTLIFNDLVLEEGMQIGMGNTSNGADTAVRMYIIYEEEDAF